MNEPRFLSATQRRILGFFHEHPHVIETVRGIAVWLRLDPEAVHEGLKELVERKWLLTHETSAVTGYALTDQTGFLNEIRQSLEEI